MELFTVVRFNCWRACLYGWFWIAILLLLHGGKEVLSDPNYLIGLGSYDITGPAADVNMMGYANTEQIASGIHFRLRARSFIVAEPQGKHVVFVNLDACMASQIVTIKVLERLKARYLLLQVLRYYITALQTWYNCYKLYIHNYYKL